MSGQDRTAASTPYDGGQDDLVAMVPARDGGGYVPDADDPGVARQAARLEADDARNAGGDMPERSQEARSAASVTDEAKRLLAGLTPEQRALLDRCTCDLARPYWHSFHREGCPLAR